MKLVNLHDFFKLHITILILIITAVSSYSQEPNRNVKLNFLTDENSYFPFGNKLNFKIGFEHAEKTGLIKNYFEFEYKKKRMTFSLFVIDSILFTIDKNKLIEICNNNNNENEIAIFDDYKIECKFNSYLEFPCYEVILTGNSKRIFKDIDSIKILVSLNSLDLVIIKVYNYKHQLYYVGEM